jgi:cyclic-di-GMP phosphodiesterase TipF (flagellum assembly factor)
MPPPVSTIDADLEMVQRKIRALADEVNTAEAMKALVVPSVDNDRLPAGLEQSIGALKDTAGAMRDRPMVPPPVTGRASRQSGSTDPSIPTSNQTAIPANVPLSAHTSTPNGLPADLFIPTTAQTIASSAPQAQPESRAPRSAPEAGPMPFDPDAFEMLARAAAPPPTAISPRVTALTHAINQGRMDVFLAPIVGLESYDVRHYEVVVRLKSETGSYVTDQDETLELAGPGMLSLFDAARLTRASIVADRLDVRGKAGSLLSQVTSASMTDSDFLETFARIYEQRGTISGQLVLTFRQRDIEEMPAGAWQALNDMQAFGFRFALDKVEHLSMDFADLARRGFAFIKLPASAFLQGIPARDHFVPPHDLCKHLAGAGLTLIVETIDQEDVRARVFGFGALLGQGQLFGGARQVSLDAPRANHTEAA